MAGQQDGERIVAAAPGARQRRAGIVLLLAAGLAPLLLNGFYNARVAQSVPLYWVVELLTWVLLPALLFTAGLRLGLCTPAGLGLHGQLRGREDRRGLLLAIAAVALAFPWAYSGSYALALWLFPHNWGYVAFEYQDMVPAAGPLRWLALAHLALSAGIVEELYFRGLLRTLFADGRRGALAFVLVSAAAFSLIHWEGGVHNLFATLLVGLGAGAVYAWLRNLWPLVIGHALTDLWWFA